MADPFLGEIRMFAGTFPPRGWSFCNGQLLSISQNDALFSLFGTIYGGDGRTTFGLPELRGRVPIHAGSGPGLTPRTIGQRSGSENVTLNVNQLPNHGHGPVDATGDGANSSAAVGNVPALVSGDDIYGGGGDLAAMSPSAISAQGGSQSHVNMHPFQALHFIVALAGIYPSQV